MAIISQPYRGRGACVHCGFCEYFGCEMRAKSSTLATVIPVAEKNKVRILWEPYAGGPNIGTGPVGWEALFKSFKDSPHVGLQFDPSHLVWQFMDPVQAARDFADKIYDVHLKDCEILWHVLRRTGINPVNNARWWRWRVPGQGAVDWKGFFAVLAENGYTGAMNIENEDEFYYPATSE
jgi:sugar phosphate isomerase/epimerase